MPADNRASVDSCSEAELLQQVRDLAAMFEWGCYHTHDSRRSEPGFPDVVLRHPKRGVMVLELKSETGRLTREQEAWLAGFEDAGIETHVVRPEHREWLAWRLGPRGHRTVDVGAWV